MMRGWRSLFWLICLQQVLLCSGTLFEDYQQCRDEPEHFGQPNGSLVCDPEGRLQAKAVEQLEGMLHDLERNVPCDCADGCSRGDGGKPEHFMALLLVSNQERVDQSGGIDALNESSRKIWDDAGMGDSRCDNGMLLIYLRDQRKMATYQGHASGRERFKLFSDQEIANLHELAINGGLNGTGNVSALPLGDFGHAGGSSSDDSGEAEVRRADESWAPVIGLSIALALTFLVLIILLALLCAKCCRVCCPSPARKQSKYYVNPMPSYKSIEPIYIVTPAGSEAAAFAAPPSGNSLYGTGTFGRHHHPPPPPPMMPHPHAIYGPPPPHHGGPHVQHPRSRSITPTSTQRIHRTYYHPNPSAGRTAAQSIHSTPEANKRDKVNRTMTVRSNGTGTYYSASQQPTPESTANGASGSVPKKKISQPPPTIHEREVLPEPDSRHQQQPQQQQPYQIEQQSFSHQQHPSLSHPPPALPFLDPWRKQEVQTREEFIG